MVLSISMAIGRSSGLPWIFSILPWSSKIMRVSPESKSIAPRFWRAPSRILNNA